MNNTNDGNIFCKIIAEFLNNRFTEDVEKEIQKWMLSDKNKSEKADASFEVWQSINVDVNMSVIDSLKEVKNKLGLSKPQENKITLGGYLLRSAAVLLPILIVIAGYIFFENQVGELSQSEMARIIEFTAPYGEHKELILPDSTHVWVNSGSTVRYPAKFKDNERRVSLSGEAFFAVSADEQRPFKVEATDLIVEAISNGFNIRAYPNIESTTVVLTQGKARIETSDKKQYNLRSWQKLTVDNKLDTISISKMSDNDLAWKTGELVFKNAKLKEIVNCIENHYLNPLTSDRPISLNNKLYTVRFTQNDKLSDVIEILNGLAPGFNIREE